MTGAAHVYLPAEPLVKALEAVEGLMYREPTAGRAMQRAREAGRISVTQADTLCVKVLHLHPSAIYGEEWWAA